VGKSHRQLGRPRRRWEIKSCHEDMRSGCIAPLFLISALDGGCWPASCSGHFIPGERGYGTHWIGGSVDRRSGLHDVERRKFAPTGTRTPTPRLSSPQRRWED
jgi:hypothetical protein